MLTFVGLAASCGGGATEEVLDPHLELRRQLDLNADRVIHEVIIGGQGAREHVVPPVVRIENADVVVFLTVDGRVHTIRFPEDSLSLDSVLFLERTRQLRSPPLVDRGSRFVLSFDGAPDGRYPYAVRGPGGEAWGTIIVTPSDG